MVKKKRKSRKSVEIRIFDKFFIFLLVFILFLEIFSVWPVTSEIVKRTPIPFLSVFYLLVFLLPLWILFSYYFKTIKKNKNACATRILFGALVKGFVSFLIFISLIAFLILETQQISIIFLSEIYIQMAVLIGLIVVVFSFLLKLYLINSGKLNFCKEENGN